MSYQEAIDYLEASSRFTQTAGVDQVLQMLDLMNVSVDQLKSVLISGTNGKGSTSASIASIAQTSGYKVGLFTSPHLFRYNERIKIDGIPISDEDFVAGVENVSLLLNQHPELSVSTFSMLTVVALLYFLEQGVDLAVLEVGIGGRLDSTNCVDPLVSVITNVDLEHTNVLGNTKLKIAYEKAGIIKSNGSFVTSESDPDLINFFRVVCEERGAEFHLIVPNEIQSVSQTLGGQFFDFRSYKGMQTNLLGQHQCFNLSCAIQVAEVLQKKGFTKINQETIRNGLQAVDWPLRLQIVHHAPTVLIDVGHNVHGVCVLQELVDSLFPRENRILIMGCSYDKPYEEMAQILSGLADTILVTKAFYHGVEPKTLADFISKKKNVFVFDAVSEAVRMAKKLSNNDALIMIFGGLYLGAEGKIAVDEVFG